MSIELSLHDHFLLRAPMTQHIREGRIMAGVVYVRTRNVFNKFIIFAIAYISLHTRDQMITK